jgi:hypothetical protein
MASGDILLLEIVRRSVGGSMKDDEATDDVITRNNAGKNAGRFNKLIFAKALRPIRQCLAQTRSVAESLTFPGLGGMRCVSAKAKDRVRQELDAKIEEFKRLVADFTARYEEHLEAERSFLGHLFRQSDYPVRSELGEKFRLSYTILPFPSIDSEFLKSLNESERAEFEAAYNQRVAAIESRSNDLIRSRILAMVDRMAETLADPKRIFRDSLVENLQGYLAEVGDLALCDDPTVRELKRICEEKLLTAAQTLRDNPDTRLMTSRSAAEIAGRFGAFKRSFAIEEPPAATAEPTTPFVQRDESATSTYQNAVNM